MPSAGVVKSKRESRRSVFDASLVFNKPLARSRSPPPLACNLTDKYTCTRIRGSSAIHE